MRLVAGPARSVRQAPLLADALDAANSNAAPMAAHVGIHLTLMPRRAVTKLRQILAWRERRASANAPQAG
jgi:hypothetical protein